MPFRILIPSSRTLTLSLRTHTTSLRTHTTSQEPSSRLQEPVPVPRSYHVLKNHYHILENPHHIFKNHYHILENPHHIFKNPYHILEMLVLVSEFLLQRRVESTHNKVAVVLIFHQFLDPTLFEEANPSTLQYRCSHILQELLVFTVSTQTNHIYILTPNVQKLHWSKSNAKCRFSHQDSFKSPVSLTRCIPSSLLTKQQIFAVLDVQLRRR